MCGLDKREINSLKCQDEGSAQIICPLCKLCAEKIGITLLSKEMRRRERINTSLVTELSYTVYVSHLFSYS